MRAWGSLAIELTGAIVRLHERGRVHGAIAPRCIFVGRTDRRTIVEFVEGPCDSSGPPAGDTLGYRSPEQLGGAPPDAKADVYAVGVILYELLAGTPPFGPARAPGLVSKILLGDAVDLAAIAPDVDPRIVQLVHRAMAYEVEARCSARELQVALLEWHREHERLHALLAEFLGVEPDPLPATPHRRVTRPLRSVGVMVSRSGGSVTNANVGCDPPIVVAAGIKPLVVLAREGE